jgi:hypothetical protein
LPCQSKHVSVPRSTRPSDRRARARRPISAAPAATAAAPAPATLAAAAGGAWQLAQDSAAVVAGEPGDAPQAAHAKAAADEDAGMAAKEKEKGGR